MAYFMVGVTLWVCCNVASKVRAQQIEKCSTEFPTGFWFGAGTSAYQTEGGWNADGKGPNIWDDAVHRNPNLVADSSNADVSGDSYHLFDRDLEIIKDLGLNFYRFSISWSRLLPNGDISSLNQAGIDYYNDVIDKLVANNIEPVVTMFHFDLPAELQKYGGVTNAVFIDYFAMYAQLLFGLFGDRVKNWITINEPRLFCVESYGTGTFAPNVNGSGVGDYLCGDRILKAHVIAYQMYKEGYARKHHGRVGIALDAFTTYKETENGTELDNRAMEYYLGSWLSYRRPVASCNLTARLGWMADPLLGNFSDYPEVMRKEIDENSVLEGRAWSRLPRIDDYWREMMINSSDFLGLNYYTSQLARPTNRTYDLDHPSFEQDVGLEYYASPKWPAANAWLKSYPRGLRDTLKWIKSRYGDIEVIITKNGWADNGQSNDGERIRYIKEHLNEVLKAIHIDKCNVKGYTYWSLLDSFEWLSGYTDRFGLYSVNFSSPIKERSPKDSALFYKNLIKTRQLNKC